ncbi:phytanoyl-CoA dioxygenase family protein [Actinoplanes rectilineatus]|uniref:phytanoyl-CoA dioxygenase family protein n=1 Tax=Actinoplanes rectilineatus TaxID=113571 RepID=UPI000AC3956D|nr:phytanoyl-CoA dioxygenase family protein [Actinoplanes rectilineatus]
MTTPTSTQHHPGVAMTDEQRADFERDGFLVVPGVLSPDEVAHYEAAVDRVYAEWQATGGLAADRSLHQLNAVESCPDLAPLLDHPKVFGLVWSMLGWNVHVYHSHLDVHPPLTEKKPFRFEWHQDGGRQNREIETDPRPRLSVKVAYWLSDVSRTGRGNFQVVPGSHRTNWIAGPPRRDMEWPNPEGTIEVTADPGDAVFFDRRIWHARSNNYSAITRKGVFFAYTYRWVRSRETLAADPATLTPVQRQLVGLADGDGDHAWGHTPSEVPLHQLLKEHGQLDPAKPPLRP